jgi:hypothetical protein
MPVTQHIHRCKKKKKMEIYTAIQEIDDLINSEVHKNQNLNWFRCIVCRSNFPTRG